MRLVSTVFLLYLVWPVSAQTERSVIFRNGKNVLSGTLTLPVGKGIHPAVLITLGSGSSNRDGEVEGLQPFKSVAAELARKGFIVLRYDNRSKDLSKGKPIDESTTEELATDAQAAFRYLGSQKEVDPRRIGFIGHSEGSTIAAIAASTNPEAKFILAINAPILSGFEDILLNTEQRLRKAGTSDATVHDYLTNLRLYLGSSTSLKERTIATRKIIGLEINQLPIKERAKITRADIASSVNSQLRAVLSRWEQHYLILNPADYYRKVSCPVRLLFSESELEGMLSRRLAVFKTVLNERKQPYTIGIIKNADHNLIRTSQHPKAVSLPFIKSIAEEANKAI